MKRVKFLCALVGLVVVNSVGAQSKQVTIRVLDKNQMPVPGTVILNPGVLRLGKTRKDGVYAFSHKCEPGQMFKAEPEDGAKFYDSSEQSCGNEVVLEVLPRPQWVLSTSEVFSFKTITLPTASKSGKVYTGVFGSAIETAVPVSVYGKDKCKLTVNKKLTVAYLKPEADEWTIDAGKLPQRGLNPGVETYYFPSTCNDSLVDIEGIRKKVTDELKVNADMYMKMNSENIDAAALAYKQLGVSK